MFNRWKGDRLIEKAHDLWTDSGDLARDGATQANSFIHRKPLAAALMGVGAGVVLGMFYAGFRRPSAEPSTPSRTRKASRR